MKQIILHINHHISLRTETLQNAVVMVLCIVMLFPFDLAATIQNEKAMEQQADSIPAQKVTQEVIDKSRIVQASTSERKSVEVPSDSTYVQEDSVLTVVTADGVPTEFSGKKIFNPDPSRAVWLSALVPGLGQVYNRRYWKLPIIIGGFMGLGYATSWNNNQYKDYTQGYRDLTDSDPATNSYMNFFPPNTKEGDFDTQWLTNTMKSRKDYYRRNRDLCIICLVGLYLLCMVDAYVDASLAHFDISDNLSMDVQPAMFMTPTDRRVTLGLNWAFNF